MPSQENARTYEQGCLDQFYRMKKERPCDPIYWDIHEENRLKKAVAAAPSVPHEPASAPPGDEPKEAK
jgi:hypothetical protein